MRLSVSDKYPQVYRLAKQGAQSSVPSPRGFLWAYPPTQNFKFQIEMRNTRNSVDFLIRILFCPKIYRQSRTCRCYHEQHRLFIVGTFVG